MEKLVSPSREHLNDLSSVILNAALCVHREMGPGLLEGVYQQCMAKELQNRDLIVSSTVPVSLRYKGMALNKDYIIDMLVENEIILELKAVNGLLPVHDAQIITYLKFAEKGLGFLINFNVTLLKFGFRRFVNNF